MRERSELRIDGLRRRPSEEGSPPRECTTAGVTGNQPTAAEVAVGQPKTRGAGRLAVLTAARTVVLLLLALVMLAAPATSSARVTIGVSVTFGPPALPYYAQPLCPGPGYIWTPGYWAWDPDYGYYWVPGTWVLVPFPGALWTPGYWAWDDADDVYVWNEGYWGPVVGFYGGIAYGYGYTGYGYEGGYWNRGLFYYNRSVNNISTTNITNVYNQTVINNLNGTRVSYNGGAGGTTARPTLAQLAGANQRRSGPVAEQEQQIRTARADPGQRASVNNGRPSVAATPKPGIFRGRDVVVASRAGAPYRPAPRATSPNREAVRPIPAQAPSPARPETSPQVTTPRRAAHPAPPIEHAAPVRREPAPATYKASPPPPAQPHPNADRPPIARQSAPRGAPQGPDRPHPPERREGPKEHKPGGPHE